MEDTRVRKATAVCIREAQSGPEVLVFEHPLDEGGFMVQLPAGSIEEGEAPEHAAMRELCEETGVRASSKLLAGVCDEDWQGEARRRWVFLFDSPDGLPEEWPFTCDCGVAIRCFWLPLETAEIVAPQQTWLQIARESYFAVPSRKNH